MLSGGRVGQRDWHRRMGRVQFFLVLLVVVPSGMVMARDAYAGPVAGAGFAVLNLAVALSLSLVMAVVRARARRFTSHRQWATRSFVLLASPLLLRLFAGFFIVTGWESANTYRWNSWASWLIPLVGYELYRVVLLRRNHTAASL